MFRSATFKLTLYYLLIIAIISFSFSIVIYQVAAHDLAIGLQQQSRRISEDFPVFSNSPYLRFSEELTLSRRHLIGRLLLCNIFVLTTAGFASYGLARRTLRPIQASHERQQRFTADASHELRTPLTALKMESEVTLLDPGVTKQQLRAALSSNIEEAEKLTNLIDNLLRLSQLDSNEQVISLSFISVHGPLNEAIQRVQPLAAKRHITIAVTEATPLNICGDASMLTQLFTILLDNAIKYSPNGSTIIVASQRNAQQIEVKISDQGIGIGKAELEQVFERFYRADSARTTSQTTSGYGLGLSIAHIIADAHDARLSLTSQLGKGTTALVSMPIADRQTMPATSQA